MEIANFNYLTQGEYHLVLEDDVEESQTNFLIIPEANVDFNLKIHLRKQQMKRVQIGIYNHHHFVINCHVTVDYQDQGNDCQVEVVCLGADHSKTEIHVKGNIRTDNNKIVQSIKGFLLSEQAKIVGLPLLDIHTNQVIANHGLAIGSLNKEQMFYLMTKGFSATQVKQILLLSQFQTILAVCSEDEQKFYLDQINYLWSQNHEEH